MKESPVQSVKSSLTQQLLSLCKPFLVYPFNCHLRLLSTQARSYPFPEPSPWRGTEGSKEDSLLFPTRGPLVCLWGRRLQNPFPPHVLPLRRLLFAFLNQNTAWNPSVCWILVPPLHFSVCQAMLAAESYGLNLWSEAQIFSALWFLEFLCLHKVILLLLYHRCERKPQKDRELPPFHRKSVAGQESQVAKTLG